MKRTGVLTWLFLVCLVCSVAAQAQGPVSAEPQSPTAPCAAAPASSQSPSSVESGRRIVSQIAAVSGTGTTNVLTKWTDTSGGLGDSAVYESGGNVGINTTSPAYSLTVTGGGAHQIAAIGAAGSNVISTFVEGTNQRASLYVKPGGLATLEGWEDGVGPLNFAVNPVGGNVGIGTTTPSQKLDVAGNVNASGTVAAATGSITAGIGTGGTVSGASVMASTGSVTAASFAGDASGLVVEGTNVAALLERINLLEKQMECPAACHLWSKRFGSTGNDNGRAVAVDSSGNVVVTGLFNGTVDFGGGGLTSAGSDDIFVAKFSGVDGSHRWSKRFGSTGNDDGLAVAVDASGNVLVTGFFFGTVDFGGGGLTSAGGNDIFVAKFSGVDGSHLWSKRLGSKSSDDGFAVAVDSSGNVVVTGFFQGTVDFGGRGLTSAGGQDIFVAKFSGVDGSHLWSKRLGGTSSDEGLAVAVDSSGNVVVTGFFGGTVDFGGGGLTSAGSFDIFVAKYSGVDGSHLWSKRFGSTSSDQARAVAVDPSGNVVVTGFFQGTVDFGGGGLISGGVDDIFVAKFSGVDGSHLWSKRLGSMSSDDGHAVAVDSSGNVVLTGLFIGTVDFGGGGLTSSLGSFDIFVAK